MRSVDERTRALLARIEALGEADLRQLHGAVRPLQRTPPAPSPAATGHRFFFRPEEVEIL
jgi:hypothetical protein